jgi:hypothetical protein
MRILTARVDFYHRTFHSIFNAFIGVGSRITAMDNPITVSDGNQYRAGNRYLGGLLTCLPAAILPGSSTYTDIELRQPRMDKFFNKCQRYYTHYRY